MKLDVNCDLGEGEPLRRTRALMRWITSANVACGGHAGDVATMHACVRLARATTVRLGAHPGPWNRRNLGRDRIEISPDELELLLLQQISALEKIARADGITLHHIKLHGALYHAAEESGALAKRYVEAVKQWWPGVKIYALAGGRVTRFARATQVDVWDEAFVDRGYRDDGSLVPRGRPGALLTDLRAVTERVRRLVSDGAVVATSPTRRPTPPRTLCIHSDTPNAVAIARLTAKLLKNRC